MSSVETGQMSAVETGQMSAAETGQMSAVETRQMLKSQIRGLAQNRQNGSKWVENDRQASRIHPHGSHGRSQAFGTGPAAKNPHSKWCQAELGLVPSKASDWFVAAKAWLLHRSKALGQLVAGSREMGRQPCLNKYGVELAERH